MPHLRFTARSIEAVKPPEKGRIEYWDTTTPWFGLRVSESGRKAWVAMYRHEGRLRRITLGTFPALSLGDARDKAKAVLSDAAHGKDPAGEKTKARRSETVRDLAGEYIERHAKANKKSWRKDQAMLDRDVLPALGAMRVKAVKRRDVVAMLDDVVDRGAPVQANRVFEVVRKMWNFAVSKDITDHNPCLGIAKPTKETSRDRVLDDAEIRTLWDALDWTRKVERRDGKMVKRNRGAMRTLIALRLILVTAQRPGEVAGAAWAELDPDWDTSAAPWWTIPGERVKNGRTHRVPLTPPAVDLLKAAKELAEDSPWVFPSPRKVPAPDGGPPRTKPISEGSLPHAVGNADAFGIEHFIPHDLRRSAGTHITGEHCGVSRFILKRVLNHVDADVTGVYDRYQYDREKRAALDAWARRLHWIVTGEEMEPTNVVALEAARR